MGAPQHQKLGWKLQEWTEKNWRERHSKEEERDLVKTDCKKRSEESVTLFAPKTFKIPATRVTFHTSTSVKTRMTSNQIKDTLSKLCFPSEELKIIFNCMKVSSQDPGDRIEALWNKMMTLPRLELRVTKTCVTSL